MAEALTEVVIEVRLPDGPLAALVARGNPGRIVFHPLSSNGSGPPLRYLACAQGIDAERRTIEAALDTVLDGKQLVREDVGSVTFVADLKPRIREAVKARFDAALEGVGGEIVTRPILVADGRLVGSFLTTRAGPVEEGVRRLLGRLGDDGYHAHILRMSVQHPAEHTFGLYEEELTEKQTEILRLALALGLYDTPRRCTLENLAHIFGISKAAAHSRMKNAERKILHRYFVV